MPTLKKYCVSSSNKRRVLRDRDTSGALQSLPISSGGCHVGRPATCFVPSKNRHMSFEFQEDSLPVVGRSVGQLENLENGPTPTSLS